MKVQVLYFQGCPNHEPAVELVRRVANESGIDISLEEIEVQSQDDAERLRFFGSPTVQVDGVDIELEARGRTDYAYSCRMYGASGLPSPDIVRTALQSTGLRANGDSTPSGSSTFLAAGGSVVAAVFASACCWLPPLLLAFGVSAAGVGTTFATLRPWMLGGAFLLLSAGFYLTYFRKASCCETDSACTVPNSRTQRFNRVMLWIALAGVLAFAFFPTHLGLAMDDGSSQLPANLPQVTLTIDGMTCEACAVGLCETLRNVPGVAQASVSYDESKATVALEHSGVIDGALADAVERAGFRVK